jgi:hypothetical protein
MKMSKTARVLTLSVMLPFAAWGAGKGAATGAIIGGAKKKDEE